MGIGTFFESLGIPFASISIQLTAGLLILSGRATFLTALFVATTGLVLGSVASYYIGYFGSRFARELLKRPPSRIVQRFGNYLGKYGLLTIALAQLYGPARTWISIPAGAARMDIKTFIIGTAIGGTVYCALDISVSVVLTRLVQDILGRHLTFTYFYIIVGLIALLLIPLYIYRSVQRQKQPAP